MKNLLVILITILLANTVDRSIAQIPDENRGLKGARMVFDINPSFAGNWTVMENEATFKLVLIKKSNYYSNILNTYVDCVEGQFDYLNKGVTIAKNIKSSDYQIILGLPDKRNNKIINATYVYEEKVAGIQLEIIDSNTLKWTATMDNFDGPRLQGSSEKPKQLKVPKNMILKRVESY